MNAMLFSLLVFQSAYAVDSYMVAGSGGQAAINEHGTCQTVTNNKTNSIFVPTKTSAEWLSFRTNLPSNVSLSACSDKAYFVLSSGTYTGNMGGLSGANASCLADLTANDWNGKSTAILDAAHVKAFLCDGTTCNNLLASKTYYFATSGNATSGGASFTTDSSGRGPGDANTWQGATFFNFNNFIFTMRASASSTLWSTASSGSHCTGLTSAGGGIMGTYGSLSSNSATRWTSGTVSCNNTYRIICIVDP